MTFSKQLLHLLFFFFFPFLNALEPKRCYSTSCGGTNFDFQFPFWLYPNQSSSCGYPGFNLYCTDHHETALNLPNSGSFLVREIKSQRIRLNDPENCLAKRLLSFDASKSPFSPLHHLVNYTFFTCPPNKSFPFKPILCLGNSTSSFFAIPFDLLSSIPSSCQIFKTLRIPISSSPVDLNNQDLWLKWDSPDCTSCDDFTPLCGFRDNTTLQVSCFAYVESGNPWLITLKIFSLCLSVPLFMFGTPALAILFCPKGQAKTKTVELSGKTKNVPWRNDTLCPICLSEYVNEDSVMSLLECEHWFHTECINHWIKSHMSCPVCRNTPSSCQLSKIVVKNVV